MAVAALALYGALQAVDGVANKLADVAWVSAPDAEKAARFASAEAVRWIEWGMRSYQAFTLGLALLLFAVAVVRTAWVPRPIAYLRGFSALTYLVQRGGNRPIVCGPLRLGGVASKRWWYVGPRVLVQGWVVGSEGFSPMMSNAIVLAEILDVVWMIWLVVVA